jgi:hypothetical protein
MRTIRNLSTAIILLFAASCVSTPQPSAGRPVFYRAYTPTDVDQLLRSKVADIEKRVGIAIPPQSITSPTYDVVPRPFSIELRRGREQLSITVLALVDASGRTVDCFVLDASDAVVARESGAIMRAAQYQPARLGGKAVASAQIFSIDGAGIPK